MAQDVSLINQTNSVLKQETPGHNRWHPEISQVVTFRPDNDCWEWTDGQIENSDYNDVRDLGRQASTPS